MKIFILTCLTLINLTKVYATNGGRGGGDLCEDQIRNIRTDLESWIKANGADGLELTNTTIQSYADKMLEAINTTKIRCVSQGDLFYPIEINGTPKVCRFDSGAQESWITCDTNKFMAYTFSDQYVLIHHEFAGIAGLENPDEDQSTYTISNQISSFLTSTIIKKLYVKPKKVGPASYKDIVNLGFVPNLETYEAYSYCKAYGLHIPSAREFAEMAASTGAVGIRETKFPGVPISDPRVIEENNQNSKELYQMIIVTSPQKTKSVAFYFNGEGFKSSMFHQNIPNIPYIISNRFLISSSNNSYENQPENVEMIFAESFIANKESSLFIGVDYKVLPLSAVCLPGLQ